jgi:hypothetical protein
MTYRAGLLLLAILVILAFVRSENPKPHTCDLKQKCTDYKCLPGSHLEKPVDRDGCFMCPVCTADSDVKKPTPAPSCKQPSCMRCIPFCGFWSGYRTARVYDENGCEGCPTCFADSSSHSFRTKGLRDIILKGSPCH